MPAAIEHLAAAIRETRIGLRLSQRQVSATSGVPQGQISRFERADVDVRLSTLVSLARALGLEVELVPRAVVPAVGSLVRAARRPARNDAEPDLPAGASRPAYRLEDEDA